jgi:hypothetical protein
VGLEVFSFAREQSVSARTKPLRVAVNEGFQGSKKNRTNVMPKTFEELMDHVENTARKLEVRNKLMQELARQL